LSAWSAQYGDGHVNTLRAALNLAVNYRDAGRVADASRLLDDWLPRVRTNLGFGHPLTQFGMQTALRVYELASTPDKAEPLLRGLAEFWKAKAGPNSREYAAQLASLGRSLELQKKHAEAEPVLRDGLAIQESTEPNAWTTFSTRSHLGGSLLGQGKFAEAEPMLLSGYEGMKDRKDTMPTQAMIRLTEALQRIVEFCVATGQPEKADIWRAAQE
jgi:hypothetical protein